MPNGDDAELKALEQELAPGMPEPPKPDATPKTPPKGEETPKTDDTKGEQPPEGEKKGDGEKADGEKPPDPLAEFAKDPKFLQKVLAHPELGPKFNRWADTAARNQVEAARREPRGPSEAEVRQKVQDEKEDKFFDEISEEDLAKELADPTDGKAAAAAYGKYRLRKEQAAKGPTPGETDYNIQVAATRSLVTTYREMVDGSDLSDEVKVELQPEKFTHLGPQALVAWGKAIYEAHIAHGVAQRWESEKETRFAELDKERPGAGGGRPPGAMSDLMGTDSSVGLEEALAAEEKSRQRK